MDSEYEGKSRKFDGIWLLSQVRAKVAGKNQTKNKSMLIRDKLIRFLLTKQYDNESVHDYFNRFKSNCDALSIVGG